jgi:hypothetical protein
MPAGLRDPAKITRFIFTIPFVGELEWEPDPTQRMAAWELYVELATRIAAQPLDLAQSSLRDWLNSLHGLFPTTRDVLRRGGPEVGASRSSVGGIAITVLNTGLRPFLSKWHPALQAHEALRPSGAAPREWERTWKDEAAARGELEVLRTRMVEYAQALATMAGVQP